MQHKIYTGWWNEIKVNLFPTTTKQRTTAHSKELFPPSPPHLSVFTGAVIFLYCFLFSKVYIWWLNTRIHRETTSLVIYPSTHPWTKSDPTLIRPNTSHSQWGFHLLPLSWENKNICPVSLPNETRSSRQQKRRQNNQTLTCKNASY